MLALCTRAALAIFILHWLPVATAQAPNSDLQRLPDYIHQCYRDDPKLAECTKVTAYTLIKKLETGIPELGIPPIEPLLKEEIDAFDVAGLHLKITDIVIRGVSSLRILWNSASPGANGMYEYRGNIEEVTIDARYELRGPVFLPIHSTGPIAGKVNIDFFAGGTSRAVTEHDIKYGKFDDIYVKMHINEGSLWIGNLGVFETPINRILNNQLNIRFIFDHVTPVIDEAIQYILLKFANRIFNTVPYDVVLPEGTGPVDTEPVGTESVPEILKNKAFFKRVYDIIY